MYEILQEPKFGTWCVKYENEYMSALERLCFCPQELNQHKNCINLKNGIYDLKKYKLHPHSSNYLSTIQLPIRYYSKADCPIFKKFLNDIFLGDIELINVMQEIIGYCLSVDMQAQCFFIFFGTGANGKSVLCNIIKEIVGNDNCSALPISDLGKSFSRADLLGKLLNISAENEADGNRPFNSQYIKSISGGDEIKAEFKGKDVFTFTPTCKLIFATNTLPKFNDKTTGFLRRVRIIPFNARFSIEEGTADINLEKKLQKELSGIFNWAILGLRRLRKNNYVFTKSKAMDEMLQEYKEMINPYIIFWNDCIIYNPDDVDTKTSKKSVFDTFVNWCLKNNHKNLSQVSARKFWYEISCVVEQLKLSPLRYKKTQNSRFVIGLSLNLSELPKTSQYHTVSRIIQLDDTYEYDYDFDCYVKDE